MADSDLCRSFDEVIDKALALFDECDDELLELVNVTPLHRASILAETTIVGS